jgi:myosin heavy subunit
MKPEECHATKDGIAKLLYENVFNFLIEWLNGKLKL